MPAKVQFKFRDDSSTDDREQLIAELAQNGADQVEPVFPEASEEELATLYSAVVADDGDVGKLLRLLDGWQEVEFAEPEVERRLILPE
jgi:hypothetical protein